MKIPTLLYHHVSDAFVNNITMTPYHFREQLQFLHENGYRGISLDVALDCLRRRHPPPPRRLLITFDDGYEDVYTTAFPILQQFDFSAVVYPIVEAVGHWNEWNRRAPYVANHLTWDQIDELSRHGFGFGCHTLAHHSLLRFGAKRVRHELQTAQAILADRLGQPITTLSYPYGDHNAQTQAIAAEFFELAFAVDTGEWNWQANPFAIRRLKIEPQTSPEQLAAMLRTFEEAGPPVPAAQTDVPDIKT